MSRNAAREARAGAAALTLGAVPAAQHRASPVPRWKVVECGPCRAQNARMRGGIGLEPPASIPNRASTFAPPVALTAVPPCHPVTGRTRPRQRPSRSLPHGGRSPGDLSLAQTARKSAVAVRFPERCWSPRSKRSDPAAASRADARLAP